MDIVQTLDGHFEGWKAAFVLKDKVVAYANERQGRPVEQQLTFHVDAMFRFLKCLKRPSFIEGVGKSKVEERRLLDLEYMSFMNGRVLPVLLAHKLYHFAQQSGLETKGDGEVAAFETSLKKHSLLGNDETVQTPEGRAPLAKRLMDAHKALEEPANVRKLYYYLDNLDWEMKNITNRAEVASEANQVANGITPETRDGLNAGWVSLYQELSGGVEADKGDDR